MKVGVTLSLLLSSAASRVRKVKRRMWTDITGLLSHANAFTCASGIPYLRLKGKMSKWPGFRRISAQLSKPRSKPRAIAIS
jgi:hypothetical protein